VFLGDSLTLKWNEYPAAFWCESFSGNAQCLSNVRPIFEQQFGWRYNAVAFGVAGRFVGCNDGIKQPLSIAWRSGSIDGNSHASCILKHRARCSRIALTVTLWTSVCGTGDSTLHLIHRLQQGELSGMKPKLVVLNIGTNDLHTYWTREAITVGVDEGSGKALIRDVSARTHDRATILKKGLAFTVLAFI
jgi:hypothetical protein